MGISLGGAGGGSGVLLTGDQTVAGVKTFSSDIIIPDEVYGAGWDGVLEPPTKNAVYDKIQNSTPLNDGTTLATSEGTTSDSFTNLATAGPAVTLTTGTKALVIISCRMDNATAAGGCRIGYAITGATTLAESADRSMETRNSDGGDTNMRLMAAYASIVEGLTAGSNTFTCKYMRTNGAGTATFSARHIAVIDLGS